MKEKMSEEAKEHGVRELMEKGKYPREVAEKIIVAYDKHYGVVLGMRDTILAKEDSMVLASFCEAAEKDNESDDPTYWMQCYFNGINQAMIWLNDFTNHALVLMESVEVLKSLGYEPMSDEHMEKLIAEHDKLPKMPSFEDLMEKIGLSDAPAVDIID